jgi:hypothetical protein
LFIKWPEVSKLFFRLYYEVIARVFVLGIIPITLLIIFNCKIFLALKRIKTFRAENASGCQHHKTSFTSLLMQMLFKRVPLSVANYSG